MNRKLLGSITLSFTLLAAASAKAQTVVTTSSNTPVMDDNKDMGKDRRSYLLDSNYYPQRRRKQLDEFKDREYRFAPKPRNMWEFGISGGTYNVLGDLPSQTIGQHMGYGVSADIRKSWSYMFSTRVQYTYGVAKGMGYQIVDPTVDRAFTGYDAGIVPNYRMESHQLNLDMMLNFGNISFSRDHSNVSFYGFLGIGALAFQTRVNQKDANGNPYNYGGIVGSTPQTYANRSTITKKLYSAMDNSYETLAETQPDKAKLGNYTLDWTPSIGLGAQFRLNDRISLNVEDRLSAPAGEDLLDGVRFANSATPALTISNDVINYTSVGINFTLGSKSKHSEPLYWINPLNFDRTPAALPAPMIVQNDIHFTMRAPKMIPQNNTIKETFPMRNSVFFDEGSTQIPARYVMLSKDQAASFSEAKLNNSPADNEHAYSRLSMYYNVLNIVGDRMRSNPQSTIMLKGGSDNGARDGKMEAEQVKQYLVDNFGIQPSRISTEAKADMPEPERGAPDRDIARMQADNRRVDIESNSPELLSEVEGGEKPYMRPVQTTGRTADPLDSFVLFNVDGSLKMLSSWSVQVTDEQGNGKTYGPYMQEEVAIPVSEILGNRTEGNFEMVMIGQAKDGRVLRKESSLNLVNFSQSLQEGSRYSILFDFDKANTVATYRKFLTNVVAPSIPQGGIVFIHGHTDNIGTPAYNQKLSEERAMDVQKTLEAALAKAGIQGVTFQTYGFGEEENTAPFKNTLPEGHFYNRTVVIDVVNNGNK